MTPGAASVRIGIRSQFEPNIYKVALKLLKRLPWRVGKGSP